MAPNVNWKGLEEIGETRILDALRLALTVHQGSSQSKA